MDLQTLIEPDRSLRRVKNKIYSCLPEGAPGGSYDGRARLYDAVVGSRVYNYLLWGTSTGSYSAFAERALVDSTGPFLDAGSGTAVFTADAYANARQPIVLADRSIEMLASAGQRISEKKDNQRKADIELLQADLFDLPFRCGTFSVILSMGMIHLFGNGSDFIQALLRPLANGGKLYLTSLVSDRMFGRQYLTMLHRSEITAQPRSFNEALNLIKIESGNAETEAWREGNMAFFIIHKID